MVHQNFLNLIEGSPGVVYSHFRVESSSDNKESSQNINLTSSTNKKYPQFLDGHYFWNAASKFSEIEWVRVYHLKEESLSDNKEFPQNMRIRSLYTIIKTFGWHFEMVFQNSSEFEWGVQRGLTLPPWIGNIQWTIFPKMFYCSHYCYCYQALCVIFVCTNN